MTTASTSAVESPSHDGTAGRTPTRAVPAACIDHPSGFLALSARNRRFTAPGLEGFIAYREQGRHWIAIGGVHAPPDQREPLLERMLAAAGDAGRRLVVVQLRRDQVPLFAARGFKVNQLGSTFGISLDAFTLGGTRKMQLRNKISRARAAGLDVVELGVDRPRDAKTYAELHAVSAAWLAAKGKKELDFMIGELGEPDDALRRVFAAVDASDRCVAFITYVPAWGAQGGYLHDLSRRLPDAPAGALELCNARAIAAMQQERVRYLHFGFTPFVVDETEFPSANRLAAWLVRKLYRYGGAVYPAASQASYKRKWGPDVVEPEYLAAKPLSLRAVLDLLLLTRSL